MNRYLLGALAMLALSLPACADEFVGPLAGWANLKTAYGAAGDGRADDTAALEKALAELGAPGKSCVLFLPVGTYRITRGLKMASHIYVSVLGEDPERTTIKWDGPAGGAMLTCNGVRYSRFGRITWDGAGRAQSAVVHAWDGRTPGANTHNEHADEVFRDVGYGIRGGSGGFMDAECPVLRCRFVRCSQAGVSIENFNALDWWMWRCTFDHCRVGVTNDPGAGHFHVYDSVFLGSTEADMKMANTSYFSVRRNVSIGSRMFFKAGWIGAGAGTTIQRNTIVEPKDCPTIQIGNLGPLLLLDNVVRGGKAPAVVLNDAAPYVSMGNTFAAPGAIRGGRKIAALDDRVASGPAPVPAAQPFPFAPKVVRPVIEAPAGSSETALQRAIAGAAKLRGKRPVVHLAVGTYSIAHTLTVPAGSDVQIVGDGYGTVLQWTGEGSGPVLHLAGPSRATLRDLSVDGGNRADSIAVEDCDQPGSRVFMEQGEVQAGSVAGLFADRLAHADVSLHDFYHSDCKGAAVKVAGAGSGSGGARVCIFGGASSSNEISYDVTEGGRLLAEDIWYEGQPPRFVRLTGSGAFTLNGAEVATADPNHGGKAEGIAAVEVNGFRGDITFLTAIFSGWIRVTGGDARTNVLALAVQGNGDDYFRSEAATANAALVGSLKYTPGGGATATPDQGRWDTAYLRRMLEMVRKEQPRSLTPTKLSATDVRFYRVAARNARVGIHLRAD